MMKVRSDSNDLFGLGYILMLKLLAQVKTLLQFSLVKSNFRTKSSFFAVVLNYLSTDFLFFFSLLLAPLSPSSLFYFNLLILYSQLLARSTISPTTSLFMRAISSSPIITHFMNFYYHEILCSAILLALLLNLVTLLCILLIFLVMTWVSPYNTSALTFHIPVAYSSSITRDYSYVRRCLSFFILLLSSFTWFSSYFIVCSWCY